VNDLRVLQDGIKVKGETRSEGEIVEDVGDAETDILTTNEMAERVSQSDKEVERTDEEVERIDEELERPDWVGEISDELDEAEERHPEWPGDETESGEKLIGEVVRTGKGPNGRLMVIQDAQTDEKLTVWECKALHDLMESVNAGDRVGLKFRGWRKSSAGREYRDIQDVRHPAG